MEIKPHFNSYNTPKSGNFLVNHKIFGLEKFRPDSARIHTLPWLWGQARSPG